MGGRRSLAFGLRVVRRLKRIIHGNVNGKRKAGRGGSARDGRVASQVTRWLLAVRGVFRATDREKEEGGGEQDGAVPWDLAAEVDFAVELRAVAGSAWTERVQVGIMMLRDGGTERGARARSRPSGLAKFGLLLRGGLRFVSLPAFASLCLCDASQADLCWVRNRLFQSYIANSSCIASSFDVSRTTLATETSPRPPQQASQETSRPAQ